MGEKHIIKFSMEIYDRTTYDRIPSIKVEENVPAGVNPWVYLKDRLVEEVDRIDARITPCEQ